MALASPSSSGSLFAENAAGTLRLLALLTASVILMVADHRGGYLDAVRYGARVAVEPLYWLAGAPVRITRATVQAFGSRKQLVQDNEALREQLLIANARLHRSDAVQVENQRLRELLGGTEGHQLSVQLVNLVDIDLDPFRHRIVLDLGAAHGVREGQALLDAGGVFGQVLEVGPGGATAILVSDPSHAIPVQVSRTSLRTIAFGTGDTRRLLLPNLPPSADIEVGDQLVTSGLGGTFPAGFPVGTVTSLQPDATRLFIVGEAEPAAALDRSGQLLLVWTEVAEGAVQDAAAGASGDRDPAPGAAGGPAEAEVEVDEDAPGGEQP